MTVGAWLADIADQTGRTFVVTGCTSGLGHHTALELARRGARVVLAARSADKLADTAAAIRREVPDADLERLVVDLSDLDSVRRGAAEAARLGPIDVLVNNAGVMATPRQRTVDGLDLQMATNHFGPFLFTGLLLPQLVAAGDARVVAVSSNGHRTAAQRPARRPAHRSRGRYSRWRRLRPDQAGQPAVHLRARPPGPRGRPAAHGDRGAPGLLRDAPAVLRPDHEGHAAA